MAIKHEIHTLRGMDQGDEPRLAESKRTCSMAVRAAVLGLNALQSATCAERCPAHGFGDSFLMTKKCLLQFTTNANDN